MLISRRHERRAAVARAPHDVGIRATHLAIVTETYRPEINGVALTLGRLADRLCRSGHRVSVVRPRQRADGEQAPDGESLVRGVPLPGYAGLQIGLARPRTLAALWSGDRPDAVYIATEGPLGWVALIAARRLGIRAVSGFHTNFHSYSRHYGLGRLQPLVGAGLSAFHRRSDATIVASPEVRDALRRDGVERVSVVGRGVDARLFDPDRRCRALRASWGATDTDVVALYVGRIAGEKNLPLAVDAFRAIQRGLPAARFVLVGDGPARAALAHRHPDLRFAGVRTGEDLARHYASADLFLFPSETDTFGNVTIEAMASGLPVVAFDYAAARQHITHGQEGWLAPLGDRTAFVHAAMTAVDGATDLAATGRRARARVSALDWDAVAQRFAAVLLDDASAAPALARHALPRMEDAT
jgi:glycosyltransferase involved in cell wall biosynthesis